MENIIVVPVSKGVLSSHFGHCEQFYFAVVKENRITESYLKTPPEHEPELYPRWVQEQGGTLVIAGGIGQKATALLAQNNIKTIAGASIDSPQKVVENFLNGTLKTTVNSCNH